jgi:ABC-2 type transport system permease protein
VSAIFARRELLQLLVQREFKARYKDSSLGFFWSLLRPLAMLLIYYVAVGKFLGAERNIPNFAIYVFAGLTIWTLFSETVSSATGSIVNNSGLIKKVDLPREIFPLSATGTALLNFGIQFVVLLGATLLTGQPPRLEALWLVPASMIVLTTYGLGLGLLLSAWNVYLRDIQHLVEIALLVLFWASPIVYSYAMVHDLLGGGFLEQLWLANPVTPAVLAFQQGMWSSGDAGHVPADLGLRLLITWGFSLILLWIGQLVFSRLEGNFAQEL